VLQSLTRSVPVVGWVIEVAFRHDSKRADRRERSTLGAVDLVHTVAIANQLAAVPSRKIEVLREHVAVIVVAFPIA
jgi:hypothetical protein